VTSSLSPFSIHVNDTHLDSGRKRKKKDDWIGRAMERTESVMKEMAKHLRSDIVAVMRMAITFKLKRAELSSSLPEQEMQFELRKWCMENWVSLDKLLSIEDLEQHIKFELSSFIPFRDVDDHRTLLDQLDIISPLVLVMTNVAFAAQALEVTSEGNSYTATREGAVGLFSDLRAVPDLHSPSCLRWEQGDVIVPVSVALHFSKMLVSFSTAIRNHSQFWLSLLLFAHRVRYAAFSDDQGVFYVFALSYSGRDRFLEVDSELSTAILEFRDTLSRLCATLRLRYGHKEYFEEDFDSEILAPRGLPSINGQQRAVMGLLASRFFSPHMENVEIVDVEHDDDDLDKHSILSFSLDQLHPLEAGPTTR
jgi:hypothetical protein